VRPTNLTAALVCAVAVLAAGIRWLPGGRLLRAPSGAPSAPPTPPSLRGTRAWPWEGPSPARPRWGLFAQCGGRRAPRARRHRRPPARAPRPSPRDGGAVSRGGGQRIADEVDRRVVGACGTTAGHTLRDFRRSVEGKYRGSRIGTGVVTPPPSGGSPVGTRGGVPLPGAFPGVVGRRRAGARHSGRLPGSAPALGGRRMGYLHEGRDRRGDRRGKGPARRSRREVMDLVGKVASLLGGGGERASP
jgi:hypothetical protein